MDRGRRRSPIHGTFAAAFGEFERYLWTFIPYVPLGQFDVYNAWRENVTGVPEGAFNAYWNIDKHE